ncbi:hypothetical protein H072_10260 [Dactylellina haptotyla CBS 200.50]|uniref:Translation initiation factor IF2/IF5 domain-containing protein n=1 Tax=Dactylellina haptotyla (strain CBS 200.50) TaxID=1284197 RepID=S8A0E2_DACHA|nr:hypothetical protein H072_10260 [Dactylellina haptotyla CBS 200.50]
MSDEEQKNSVAFGETTNIENGEKVELEEGTTAEGHSVTESFPVLLGTNISANEMDERVENGDATATFDPTAMKKKSKKSKKEATGENGEEPKENGEPEAFDPKAMKKKKTKKTKEAEGEEGGDAVGEFDPSKMRRGGKKKPKKGEGEDEFQKRLEELGLEDKREEPAQPQTQEEMEAELQQGTGVWAQDNTIAFKYSQLLKRFYINLYEDHPELSGEGRLKNYKIPPPQVVREGNKKSIFVNLPEIARKMKRNPDHIIQFIFAELGTNGSVDGSGRLVIKGRFQQKQLESVLRRYIVEYLTCGTCKSPNTTLNKENRLFFVSCNICGSRKSVSAIKTGFQAALGKRRKQQA